MSPAAKGPREFEAATGNTPPSIAVTEVQQSQDAPDAGMRSLDHYKRKLSPWQHNMRKRLLPLIRWETPYLAWMQDRMRSPALDSYFSITANLGTHTFFMVVLPIMFWCGHTALGRGMVHILASGVFFTGFIKDMMSLPRPLSPPLQRITMSGSAALEYGFPSTHSANAVSVAVYALYSLRSLDCQLSESTKLILELVSYAYALSITIGRLYCGMHGFVDVICGSLIGALITVIECESAPMIDSWIYNSTWRAPVIIALTVIVLVRIHPEPADDCPCFDDSVAFAGVIIGVEAGGWHYSTGSWSWDLPVPATVPFSLEHMGWLMVIARVLVGVLVIFAWRGLMKPLLLKTLPHLFRAIEKSGFILPRKFFMPASEYSKIPSRLKVDNVMPSVSDLPGLLTSIRHPGRGRSVSIGPQSAADVYETLAYREKRRRDSLTNDAGSAASLSRATSPKRPNNLSSTQAENDKEGFVSQVPGISASNLGFAMLSTPLPSRIGSYEQMMGTGQVSYPPPTPPADEVSKSKADIAVTEQHDERGEKVFYSQVEKPRVRYDVEVVTKIVIYGGIGWLAVEINPIIFELIGLGMGSHRPV